MDSGKITGFERKCWLTNVDMRCLGPTSRLYFEIVVKDFILCLSNPFQHVNNIWLMFKVFKTRVINQGFSLNVKDPVNVKHFLVFCVFVFDFFVGEQVLTDIKLLNSFKISKPMEVEWKVVSNVAFCVLPHSAEGAGRFQRNSEAERESVQSRFKLSALNSENRLNYPKQVVVFWLRWVLTFIYFQSTCQVPDLLDLWNQISRVWLEVYNHRLGLKFLYEIGLSTWAFDLEK